MKQRRGFTLLELLTVIGVAGILVAVGFPSMQSMRQNASLNGGAQEVASIIRQTQGQAIANTGGSAAAHSVQYTSATSYTVASGGTTRVYSLPSGIMFPNNFGTIAFSSRLGLPSATPTIDLNGGSNTKHISISPTGVVTLQ